MRHYKLLTYSLLAMLLLCISTAHAAVLNPWLDIQDNGPFDTGLFVDSTTFKIDATAFSIITVSGPVSISEIDFKLDSDSTGTDGLFSGTFSIDGGTALSGTFTDLEVSPTQSLDSGSFKGDVSYTSGYLAGSYTGGRLEGNWNSSGMVAKLGPVVVPVPAAVWLFGSGLMGLIAVSRRKQG